MYSWWWATLLGNLPGILIPEQHHVWNVLSHAQSWRRDNAWYYWLRKNVTCAPVMRMRLSIRQILPFRPKAVAFLQKLKVAIQSCILKRLELMATDLPPYPTDPSAAYPPQPTTDVKPGVDAYGQPVGGGYAPPQTTAPGYQPPGGYSATQPAQTTVSCHTINRLCKLR